MNKSDSITSLYPQFKKEYNCFDNKKRGYYFSEKIILQLKTDGHQENFISLILS